MTTMSHVPGLRRSDLLLSTEYVPPDDEMGQAIAGIWQRVLNSDQVGLHDDFFEFGGDSLGVAVLASELEKRFGCKFQPGRIIEASTVAAQASYIKKKQRELREVPSNLILCHAEGKKKPLFIIHGAVGFTIYDKRFLEGLDADRPVVFIEAVGLDGREPALDRIEAIAAHYLCSMRQVFPSKNWLLAANCAGGLIALEMCKQAEATGEKVDCLMLVDPLPRIFKKAAQIRLWRWMRRLRTQLCRVLRLNPGVLRSDDPGGDAYDKSLDYRRQRQDSLEHRIRKRIGEQPSSFVPSEANYSAGAMREVSRCLGRAFRNYASSKWNGSAFVLTSDGRKRDIGILKSYFPKARFRCVPYHHGNLFTEGLSEIQLFLNDALRLDKDPSAFS